KLIKDGIISQERVNQMVRESYLPHVVPAAFALDNYQAISSTHAPVGKDAIDAMVKRLQINTDDFPKEWEEGEQLAAKVEISRALFQWHVRHDLFLDELINHEYVMILGGQYPERIRDRTNDLSEYIFEYLAWSRQTEFTPDQRPAALSDGRRYIASHGH